MGDIIKGEFSQRGKVQGVQKVQRVQKSTLCKHGHHRWEIDKTSRFDVKRGKLVTLERCSRCGKTRRALR